MHDLMALLNSIPTNSCPNREEAKRDVQSALSMNSKAVIKNINHCWIDIDQEVIENLIQEDAQYRAFLVDFWERCNGQDSFDY